MRTSKPWRRPTPIPNNPARLCFLLLGAALLAAPGSACGDHPSSAVSEPYSMYMGADLTAEWQGALRPVRDMQDGRLVLDVDGRRVVLAAGRPVNIRVKRALKVAPAGIAVRKFEANRAYTYDNDPNRLYEAGAELWAQAQDQSDMMTAHVNVLTALGGLGMNLSNTSPPAPIANDPAGGASSQLYYDLAGAQTIQVSDYAAEDQAIRQMANLNELAGDEKAREQFDAFSLGFEISSPQPIDGCYAVVIALLRSNPDDPKSAQQRIYAQPLGRIGERPAKIRFFGGGFPKGYQLIGAEVHVYKAGVELDTTAAPKRFALSADDAFQFAVAEYVGAHHGATLPAVAATGVRRAASMGSGTYYLRVARDGVPAGAFTDEACTEQVSDQPLAAALSALRFYPALKAGRPVESVIPLRL